MIMERNGEFSITFQLSVVIGALSGVDVGSDSLRAVDVKIKDLIGEPEDVTTTGRIRRGERVTLSTRWTLEKLQ